MAYLVCDKCGEYYELQPEESPDDFIDKCECGGNLIYLQYECPNCGSFMEHKQASCPSCGFLKEEKKYHFFWSMVFLPLVIIVFLFGMITAKFWIIMGSLGLLGVMVYTTFLENKLFSKLEKILDIQLKKNNGFRRASYTPEGLALNFSIGSLILGIIVLVCLNYIIHV